MTPKQLLDHIDAAEADGRDAVVLTIMRTSPPSGMKVRLAGRKGPLGIIYNAVEEPGAGGGVLR